MIVACVQKNLNIRRRYRVIENYTKSMDSIIAVVVMHALKTMAN